MNKKIIMIQKGDLLHLCKKINWNYLHFSPIFVETHLTDALIYTWMHAHTPKVDLHTHIYIRVKHHRTMTSFCAHTYMRTRHTHIYIHTHTSTYHRTCTYILIIESWVYTAVCVCTFVYVCLCIHDECMDVYVHKLPKALLARLACPCT